MKTLLKNAYIVTMDPDKGVYTRGYVIVENDRIAAVVSGEAPAGTYDEVIDCDGKIVMPSFINTHVHTSQQLGRGLGDDVNLLTWLHDRIWPYESNMTEDDSYVSTLLCCAEQIKAGCTLFAEPGGQFVSGMARGVTEAGIRGKLANSIMDCGEGLPKNWVHSTDEEIARTVEDIKNFHNTADGRVQVWFGLRTIFNNTDELILRSKEEADKYGVGVHMHVAEVKDEVEYLKAKIGVQTVTHLNDLGVLDKNFLAVHTVWLTNDEVLMFKEHDVKVSHNPAAAMRVLGFAKVPRMLREGICVTIGTDGAPSNNRMDIVVGEKNPYLMRFAFSTKYMNFGELILPRGGHGCRISDPESHKGQTAIYVKSGALCFIIRETRETFKIYPGEVMYIPENTVYQMMNYEDEAARAVFAISEL